MIIKLARICGIWVFFFIAHSKNNCLGSLEFLEIRIYWQFTFDYPTDTSWFTQVPLKKVQSHFLLAIINFLINLKWMKYRKRNYLSSYSRHFSDNYFREMKFDFVKDENYVSLDWNLLLRSDGCHYLITGDYFGCDWFFFSFGLNWRSISASCELHI